MSCECAHQHGHRPGSILQSREHANGQKNSSVTIPWWHALVTITKWPAATGHIMASGQLAQALNVQSCTADLTCTAAPPSVPAASMCCCILASQQDIDHCYVYSILVQQPHCYLHVWQSDCRRTGIPRGPMLLRRKRQVRRIRSASSQSHPLTLPSCATGTPLRRMKCWKLNS